MAGARVVTRLGALELLRTDAPAIDPQDMSPRERREERRRRLPPLVIGLARSASLDVRWVAIDGDGNRAFLATDRGTGESLLVDPAGDRARVLELVYDAQDEAADEGVPAPEVVAIVRTSRDARDEETVRRVRERLGVPVLDGSADGDTDGNVGGGPREGRLGASVWRILPLQRPAPADTSSADTAPAGIALAVGDPARPDAAAQIFVGDALDASGPPRFTRDRPAAMRFTMQLERGVLAAHDDDSVVWPRSIAPETVGALRTRTTEWRRANGLPASTEASPVWFSDDGAMVRLRRMHPDPGHADHRFVMLMIGATVHAVVDPDDAFAFAPAFGQYAATAALLGLEPDTAPRPPLRALHLGSGALAVPRVVEAAHPGSRHTVVDIEPIVPAFVLGHLPLAPGTSLELVTGDARETIERLADAGAGAEDGDGAGKTLFDLVVVDVFDGLTVPASISDAGAFATVRRLLAPGGTMLFNTPIDPDEGKAGPGDSDGKGDGDRDGGSVARRAIADIREAFAHVAVAGYTDVVAQRAAGNLIVAASDAPLATGAAVAALRREQIPHALLEGEALAEWLEGTHAPTC